MTYFNPGTRIGIVKVMRDSYRIAHGALTLLKKLNKSDCRVTVLHVAGTLRSLREQAIKRDQKVVELLEAKAERMKQIHSK